MGLFGLQRTSVHLLHRLARTQLADAISLSSQAQRRKMSHFRVIEHTVRSQHVRERQGATEPGQANSLRLAVKQYVPRTNPEPAPGDVTFIGAHANGFPKVCTES